MAENTLDYQTSDRPPTPWNFEVLQAAFFAGIFTIAVNAVLYGWAYAEGGWGAMLIFGLAILVNILLVVIFLAFIPIVRRVARGDPIKIYVLVSILVPVATLLVFFVCMSAIPRDLHAAP